MTQCLYSRAIAAISTNTKNIWKSCCCWNESVLLKEEKLRKQTENFGKLQPSKGISQYCVHKFTQSEDRLQELVKSTVMKKKTRSCAKRLWRYPSHDRRRTDGRKKHVIKVHWCYPTPKHSSTIFRLQTKEEHWQVCSSVLHIPF